jgi:cation:H+ antiporter
MLLACVQVLAGLAALVVGAELLVRGAVWIALVLGISRMAVGLTLVAFGTSMPELMVSLVAAAEGRSAIAFANAIGSNTFNVLGIVGIAAAIRAIRLRVDRLELHYMLLATALAAVPFVRGHRVDRVLGGAMLAMLASFCLHLLLRERRRNRDLPADEVKPRASPAAWVLNLGLVAGSLLTLKYGADWLVAGSVVIARELGMTEALIGMTIVAIGTSLPELATSVLAARKGQPEIAIGNIVGSNIFNVGAVLGISSLLVPFPVLPAETGPLMAATAVSAILLAVVLRACDGVPRAAGPAFVLGYVGFIAFEVVRSAGQ